MVNENCKYCAEWVISWAETIHIYRCCPFKQMLSDIFEIIDLGAFENIFYYGDF